MTFESYYTILSLLWISHDEYSQSLENKQINNKKPHGWLSSCRNMSLLLFTINALEMSFIITNSSNNLQISLEQMTLTLLSTTPPKIALTDATSLILNRMADFQSSSFSIHLQLCHRWSLPVSPNAALGFWDTTLSGHSSVFCTHCY